MLHIDVQVMILGKAPILKKLLELPRGTPRTIIRPGNSPLAVPASSLFEILKSTWLQMGTTRSVDGNQINQAMARVTGCYAQQK